MMNDDSQFDCEFENVYDQSKKCPKGWIGKADKGSCYKIYTNPLGNQDAAQICYQEGAELVEIESQMEDDMINEIFLGASEYSSAADIWSVGCIFAELLLRRPFLQGNQTDISQLDTIFQVFGTPTETNWPDHSSLPLCTRGLKWDNCPPIHQFDEIFIAAPQDCISLLRSMLVLDPNKRFTASQCLSHPYFTNEPAPTPKEKLVLSSK